MQQYTTVLGFPRYPTKTHENIQYFTGTCIDRVINIRKHIPRFNFLFGRQIRKYIYTGQPKQKTFQKKTTAQPDYTERQSETNTETQSDNDTDTHVDSNSTQSDTETNNTEKNDRYKNNINIDINQEINNQTNTREKTYRYTNNKQLEKQNEKHQQTQTEGSTNTSKTTKKTLTTEGINKYKTKKQKIRKNTGSTIYPLNSQKNIFHQ